MSIFEYVSLLRGIAFLWVSATSFSISQLYRDGYVIAKKESNIIKSLVHILFWLSIVFGYLAITAFSYAFDLDAHQYVVFFMPIIMLPLGFLLTKFRQESIRRQDIDDEKRV